MTLFCKRAASRKPIAVFAISRAALDESGGNISISDDGKINKYVIDNWLFNRMTNWAEETFPQRTNHSILTHLRRELDEIEANPDDLTEWADVILLFMHGLRERNFNIAQLVEALEKKFEINKNRKWGTPDEHGVVELEKGEN